MMKSFRGFKFFVLLFIAFLFLVGIYLFLQRQPSVFPIKPGQEEKTAYSKRQFDINSKFYLTQSYPSELVSIKDKDLIGISCSPVYIRQIGGKYTLGTDPKAELRDRVLLEVVGNVNKTINNYVSIFRVCDTENMMRIVEYELWAGGGGSRNVAYFGIVNDNGNVETRGSIKTDGSIDFACGSPLQLTTSNIFYYDCGGGDGRSGSASIYEIDLNNKTSTRIIKCDSSANPNGKPFLQCQ